MRVRISSAIVLAAVLAAGQSVAQAPVGDFQKNQTQRQQTQDELNLKIKQYQEANRPNVTPEQRKDLDQQHQDQLESQRQLQQDQSRRQQQLEQSIQTQPETRQKELLNLQELLFGREKIQEPRRDQPRPGPPEVVK